MDQRSRPARTLVLCFATLLAGLCLEARVAADDRVPCKPPCACTANVTGYGFFKTSWREWPGESRLDKTFPSAIGKEVLPTPKPQPQQASPQEVLPTPKPMESPGGETPTGPGTNAPDQGTPSEGILPKPGALQINPVLPRIPSELQPPSESGQPSTMLPLPEGLRGLPPDEPNPLTPGEKPPADRPLPAETQPPADEAKPSDKNGPEPTTPPTTTKADADQAEDRWKPRGSELRFCERSSEKAQQSAEKAHKEVIQADWTEALEPACHSDLDRWPLAHSATQPVPQAEEQPAAPSRSELPAASRVAQAKPPVRQTAERLPAQPQSGRNAPRQVFEQPIGEAAHVANRASHSESATVALDGYCPVELIGSQRWVKGDSRYSMVHQGATYLFSGAAQRQRFLADPDHYLPACSGRDPVLAVDGHRDVAGRTAHSAIYDGRLYLFSSTATLARFRQDPRRYAVPAGKP